MRMAGMKGKAIRRKERLPEDQGSSMVERTGRGGKAADGAIAAFLLLIA